MRKGILVSSFLPQDFVGTLIYGSTYAIATISWLALVIVNNGYRIWHLFLAYSAL